MRPRQLTDPDQTVRALLLVSHEKFPNRFGHDKARNDTRGALRRGLPLTAFFRVISRVFVAKNSEVWISADAGAVAGKIA